METEFALSLGTQHWPLPSTADEITIGRASNADVRLPADDQISRIHARLTRDGATWTLHDASRNGTGLNGRRLTAPTPLNPHDQIHIGRSVLTFTPTQPNAATPGASTSGAGTPNAGTAGAGTPSAGTPGVGTSSAGAGTPGAGTPGAGTADAGTPNAGTPNAGTPNAGTSGVGSSGAGASTAAAGTAAAALATPGPAATPSPPPPAGSGPTTPRPTPTTPLAPDTPHTPANPTPAPDPSAPSAPRTSPAADHPAQTESPAAAASPPDAETPRGAGSPGRGTAGAGTETAGPSTDANSGRINPTTGSLDTQAQPPATQAPPPGTRTPSQGSADRYTPRPYPAADYPAQAKSPAGPANPPQGSTTPANRADDVPADSPFAPADARQPDGPGAAWPGYPSADYLESARSPWSAERPQITQPEPQVADWNIPDDDEPRTPDRPTKDRKERETPVRRTDTPDDTEVGLVRLPRVLAVAGALLLLGLVVNLIVTFATDGPNSLLRWLVAPTIALITAMVVALLDALNPADREPGRLDVSVVVAIAVVLLGVGVGGFALTAGAEYTAGYLSGNESGEDRLVKPVGKTAAGFTFTVSNVTYTSHFTRVELVIVNKGNDTAQLPLDADATFTSADGNTVRADPGRSNWPGDFPPGSTQETTIVFKGHLPKGLKTATLTLRPGEAPITLGGIALSN
ncbi:FHA domain-containing protein [Kribbella sandramycini]|uniref:FHA domain-containing protein n=1 Tax=Kribbella sandramycini TaxID=60450 RepID=A0A7Y4NY11_9ACTN|nr:hypothetical protein [Kribbella sandramycini]NOL40041.1 FHA domain-containing protein [Kribbella sandramycini]